MVPADILCRWHACSYVYLVSYIRSISLLLTGVIRHLSIFLLSTGVIMRHFDATANNNMNNRDNNTTNNKKITPQQQQQNHLSIKTTKMQGPVQFQKMKKPAGWQDEQAVEIRRDWISYLANAMSLDTEGATGPELEAMVVRRMVEQAVRFFLFFFCV